MENKPVDLATWSDFCTVSMGATARNFDVTSMQSRLQSPCDCIKYTSRGLEARGCRGDLYGGSHEMPCADSNSVWHWCEQPIACQNPSLTADPPGTPAHTFLGQTSRPEGLAMLWMLLETRGGRCSWKDTAEKMLMRRHLLERGDPRWVRDTWGTWCVGDPPRGRDTPEALWPVGNTCQSNGKWRSPKQWREPLGSME